MFATCFAMLVVVPSVEPNAGFYLARSDASCQAGRLDDAILDAQVAAELAPADPVPPGRLAELMLRTGRPAAALVAADRAVRLAAGSGVHLVAFRGSNRDAAGRYELRARALFALGEPEASLETLHAAVAADPECLPARMQLGRVALAAGDAPGAEAHFSAVIQADPQAAGAFAGRGSARFHIRHPGARADLDTAVALDPALADGWEVRGMLRGDAGDHSGAAADFAEALKFEPRHASMAGLATARLHLGDPAGAERAVTVGLAFATAAGDRARLLAVRADAHARRGDYGRAAADLDRAVRYDPDNGAWVAARGDALARLGGVFMAGPGERGASAP